MTIHADLENEGMAYLDGFPDIIMTEYTVLTGMVLKRMEQEYGKDKAYEMLAKLGQIAVNNNLKTGASKIQDEIMEVLKDEQV